MRYIVNASEIRKYDKNTIERIGIPALVLMERAALGTFDAIKEKGIVSCGANACILAGYGNNGGDGLALARLLSEQGMNVEVWLVGDASKATDSWKEQNRILQSYPVKLCHQPEAEEYNVIIDALFGVGLTREIKGEYADALQRMNHLKGYKVAMDIPSGISADTGEVMGIAFKADLTVTYGFEKVGSYLYPGREYCGEIKLARIGISERAFFDDDPQMFCLDSDFEELFPARKQNGNKGIFGKALIIAGSYQMAGAAILAAKACYCAGAGMVKVLTCTENRVILQETVPEALLGTLEDLEESIKWCSVICIGPGMGKGEEARNAFLYVLRSSEKPVIIDADGLNLLSEDKELCATLRKEGEKGRKIFLTPHLAELKRIYLSIFQVDEVEALTLMDKIKVQPWIYALKTAEFLSAVVVAKDARTFVCAQGKAVCMNLSGNSGMGTAGSGDVLAGILTGFICQGENGAEFETACRAVRVHGLAGDAAKEIHGEHGMVAGDLIEALRDKKTL